MGDEEGVGFGFGEEVIGGGGGREGGWGGLLWGWWVDTVGVEGNIGPFLSP